MTKPITPEEVSSVKQAITPEVVFEIFNSEIVENWDGNSSFILQSPVASRIANALDITREEVFKKGYLDVEEFYRNAGWKVSYNKPGWNESYGAYFEFTK